MRQHVNPLSINFNEIESIPSLSEMFGDAKLKVRQREIKNLYFVFGNAHNILNDVYSKFIIKKVKSISFFN